MVMNAHRHTRLAAAAVSVRPAGLHTPRGARMSYLDEGQGSEAVLMLHGNPTWSFYYRELVQAVAPRTALHRARPHRHGPVGEAADLSLHAGHAHRRCGGAGGIAGLTKVHLVVHDWGGAIGLDSRRGIRT
jgi:pimeloyl-ACP methyl ester carboxylesterase